MSSVLSQLTALLPPVPADNVYLTAALWIGLALIASLISIRIGVSVALVEIVVGMLAGNFPICKPTSGSTSWPASAASC